MPAVGGLVKALQNFSDGFGPINERSYASIFEGRPAASSSPHRVCSLIWMFHPLILACFRVFRIFAPRAARMRFRNLVRPFPVAMETTEGRAFSTARAVISSLGR